MTSYLIFVVYKNTLDCCILKNGAMILSVMTLRITPLSMITLNIMIPSIRTLNIRTLSMATTSTMILRTTTFRIAIKCDTQHNDTLC